ncbi:transcriptional regulator [Crocosphaera sp. UHCC 0190]|uniref:helix-turn-helix domain-containing protein n=1 Tax=Crocosphaera sp. UHCC 0190 TaxID=3110246 RepID=UPI002B204910|nr:transcriptional regulator [Crocosphaera sp. UHCC 0190]MEA5512141.1 transcriptional regulator [Crocosphaera sp. UHCC 0190]
MVKYQPKPIKTKQDYEQFLGIIEEMMSRTLTKDEDILFELLVLLIEAYEQQYYPINKTNLTATLESLIHEFDVNYESIIDIFGDIKTLEAIMTEKQEISPSQAESLAEFFNHLSPKLALTSHNFTQIKV